ncbi:MAG: hypothetical protein AB7H88_18085 [Vicinamibacterales bacterium]
MKAVTLDTNLLLEYWKGQDKRAVVEQLIALGRAGKIDLAVTARIRDDVPYPPLSEEINRLPVLSVDEIGSVFRLDLSTLDSGDMLGDDDFLQASSDLSDMLIGQHKTPPDWRDWDHLHAHYLSGRDVFLTWDRRVLDVAEPLAGRFRMVVLSPEAFLADVQAQGPAA